MLALIAVLNILAWNSRSFCDVYVTYVFPIWVNTYGRFTGIFPFSVGEWMIGAGLLLLVFTVIFGAAALILKIRRRKCPRWMRGYFRFFVWTLLSVGLIMMLNCFLLYHVTPFADKYLNTGNPAQQNTAEAQENSAWTQEYSADEFLRLRNKVVARCNELSAQVQRNEEGYIVYPGSVSQVGEHLDMRDKAREEMRRLGSKYPQLAGFYPRPKPLLTSDFMCQQYTLGWYFPFSMEANYNDVAYVMNLPATMCHELAHLKGFIYEDEANFIGYLACVESDDIYFEYSGYLSVLGYLERDLAKAAKEDPEGYAAVCEAQGLVQLLDVVYEDDIFVTDEEWERIEGKALIETETMDQIADAFVDTTLKVNGVSDGMMSYSRVVELMLLYERGQ